MNDVIIYSRMSKLLLYIPTSYTVYVIISKIILFHVYWICLSNLRIRVNYFLLVEFALAHSIRTEGETTATAITFCIRINSIMLNK